MYKKLITMAVTICAVLMLSSCAMFASWGEEITRAFNGVEAKMTTYNQDGQIIDQVKGKSFRVSRDDRFDKTNSSGEVEEGSVLLISLGDNHISHVGSTMILSQEGLKDIYHEADGTVDLENQEAGTPWLNDFLEKNRNLWKGNSKTIMIRSQDGDPIAVYSGNTVEIMSTDVPQSTNFRVDGKYLFVYRADYTVYDNALLVK